MRNILFESRDFIILKHIQATLKCVLNNKSIHTFWTVQSFKRPLKWLVIIIIYNKKRKEKLYFLLGFFYTFNNIILVRHNLVILINFEY